MALSPGQRSQRARIAALARWATESPTANAARGQAGLLNKFRQQVQADDPSVQEPELTRRAESARKAHMARLSFKASKARAAKSSDGGGPRAA